MRCGFLPYFTNSACRMDMSSFATCLCDDQPAEKRKEIVSFSCLTILQYPSIIILLWYDYTMITPKLYCKHNHYFCITKIICFIRSMYIMDMIGEIIKNMKI